MNFLGAALITKDVKRLVGFYGDLFQTEAEGDETHSEFRIGNGGLAIFSGAGMEQMAPGSTEGMGYGSVVLMFEVEDADAEYERITQSGIRILKPIETHPWGARSFWLKDPDGNILDFVKPPEHRV